MSPTASINWSALGSRLDFDTSLDFLMSKHGFIVTFFKSRYSRGLCAGVFSTHEEAGIFEDVLTSGDMQATRLHQLIDSSSWLPIVADCMTIEEARQLLELRLLMLGQQVMLNPHFRYALQELCKRLKADPLYSFDPKLQLEHFCDTLTAHEKMDELVQHDLIAIGVQAHVHSVIDVNYATFITNAEQLQTLQALVQRSQTEPAQMLSMHASAWFPIDHGFKASRAFDCLSYKLEKAMCKDSAENLRAAIDKFYLLVKDNPGYVLPAGQSAHEFLQG